VCEIGDAEKGLQVLRVRSHIMVLKKGAALRIFKFKLRGSYLQTRQMVKERQKRRTRKGKRVGKGLKKSNTLVKKYQAHKKASRDVKIEITRTKKRKWSWQKRLEQK